MTAAVNCFLPGMATSMALGDLARRGVPLPAWREWLGEVVPGKAWRYRDVFGDQEAVLVSFSYLIRVSDRLWNQDPPELGEAALRYLDEGPDPDLLGDLRSRPDGWCTGCPACRSAEMRDHRVKLTRTDQGSCAGGTRWSINQPQDLRLLGRSRTRTGPIIRNRMLLPPIVLDPFAGGFGVSRCVDGPRSHYGVITKSASTHHVAN
jgi:hypothetical protein